MALIVEDGTGMSTAEAYASVAAADAYWAARGAPAAWTSSTTDQKEVALRLATDYLDSIAARGFRGARVSTTQRLSWPRIGVVVDGIALPAAPLPRGIVEAAIEAALRARTETSGLLPDDSESGIAAESVALGSIRESKEYLGAKTSVKRFNRVDALLRPYVANVTAMERA